MYDFHDSFIKKHFDTELLFIDTDSLTCEIKSEMFIKNILIKSICLTLVTIQKIQFFFDPTNKKDLDQSEGKITDGFVGSKSKIYSMKNTDGKQSNTAKGVNIATELTEFKETLFKKKIIRHKMSRIRGKKHKMGTYEINKIFIICF